MVQRLQKRVIEEFGGAGAQRFFSQTVDTGLWISEMHFIEKYFCREGNARGKILDIGCGAGRTTIPLQKMGFDVIGIDIVPQMIESAKIIAKEKGLTIQYQVGNAEQLNFSDNTFEYALFSCQGWTQIPERAHRQQALKEIFRILKPNGIFIFSGHTRMFFGDPLFWTTQWVKVRVLKSLSCEIEEEEFGDIFFTKESADIARTYTDRQFIHFPTVKETSKEIKKAGFTLIEANNEFQISRVDVRKHPPVLYIVQK